jgi:hypothetical protein
MKKLFNVLALVLAVNFLAVAGGVGWLYQSRHLDRERIGAIREILFPTKAIAPTTQPSTEDAPTTQPIMRIEELLARATGHTAAEQVESIQHAFDAQTAQLDRRQRELNDLQRQVDLAKAQMARDRAALEGDQKNLADQKQQATKLAADKGFQDSLLRYQAMPGKQVKQIFMTLDDQTVMNYLQEMEPRSAARVIKEFKTPEEVARVQTVLERMRLAQAPTKE